MLPGSRLLRAGGVLLEVLLACFVLALVAAHWVNKKADANSSASAGFKSATAVVAMQGTPVVATINGSINGAEKTFTTQRHFRRGVPGDRNCEPFGVIGPRFYDEVLFQNTSSQAQRVSIGFTSMCGSNTYMAAYTPRFDPTSICAGAIASAGLSGSANWDFIVCAGAQFSLVVYGLEPGITCSGYSYTVFASGVIQLPQSSVATGGSTVLASREDDSFAATDITRKKAKRRARFDSRFVPDAPSEPVVSAIPVALAGTPLATTITGSLTPSDLKFVGRRHLVSGIVGDANCALSSVVSTRIYDEVLFLNTSSSSQKVSVAFTSTCGSIAYIAAYSPQFDPGNVCTNLLAQSGRFGPVNFEFTVCANSQFSIVVYALEQGLTCGSYSYSVFGESITVKFADVAVSKAGPSFPGPVPAGTNITYTVTASNNGPNPVTNVVLNDPLPAGTTFVSLSLLSSIGTALPAPICITPPVGGTGAVSCLIPFLPAPGTALISSLDFALTIKSGPGGVIKNTATVVFPGVDTNPANNTSTATVGRFLFCIRDDATARFVETNSATGDYKFTDCAKGTVISGRGTVSSGPCKITILDTGPDSKKPDRKISIQVDPCGGKGAASIQIGKGPLITISDSNISNSVCSCAVR